MEFRTQIQTEKPVFTFSHKETTLLLGSCFAENIGEKLSNLYFPVDINPFGTLYNPASVASGIRMLLEVKPLSSSSLFLHEGMYHSFTHHSRFSGTTEEKCLRKINERHALSSGCMKNAKRMIITFGTAWVYRLKTSGEIVANCHKLPDKLFRRECLSVQEIVAEWEELLASIWQMNPSLKILFTVSPVRHWKDGAHGNQLSKSTLLLAINELQRLFPEQTDYFPAYELMIDELRDYRFYADDMLHPSPLAIEYIWERFSDMFFPCDTQRVVKELAEIEKAVSHRPFNPETEAHRRFQLQTLQKMKRVHEEIHTPAMAEAIKALEDTLS